MVINRVYGRRNHLEVDPGARSASQDSLQYEEAVVEGCWLCWITWDVLLTEYGRLVLHFFVVLAIDAGTYLVGRDLSLPRPQ